MGRPRDIGVFRKPTPLVVIHYHPEDHRLFLRHIAKNVRQIFWKLQANLNIIALHCHCTDMTWILGPLSNEYPIALTSTQVLPATAKRTGNGSSILDNLDTQ